MLRKFCVHASKLELVVVTVVRPDSKRKDNNLTFYPLTSIDRLPHALQHCNTLRLHPLAPICRDLNAFNHSACAYRGAKHWPTAGERYDRKLCIFTFFIAKIY